MNRKEGRRKMNKWRKENKKLKKERKARGEREGGYLLGCMIGIDIGTGRNSGASCSFEIPKHVYPTGFKTLILSQHLPLPHYQKLKIYLWIFFLCMSSIFQIIGLGYG